jgi:hypothetical protein
MNIDTVRLSHILETDEFVGLNLLTVVHGSSRRTVLTWTWLKKIKLDSQ